MGGHRGRYEVWIECDDGGYRGWEVTVRGMTNARGVGKKCEGVGAVFIHCSR